jgi:hypothetical protein
LREDKSVGSVEGKELGSGHRCEKRREVEQGHYGVWSELIRTLTLERLRTSSDIGKATLGRNFDVDIRRVACEAVQSTK